MQSPSVAISLHLALNFLAFEAARLLKRPKPSWKQVEKDFAELPAKLAWVFTQLPDIVRSLAKDLAQLPRLRIVGGGFYEYPAWRAAERLAPNANVEAVEATRFLAAPLRFARKDESVLFLSGSQSRLRKTLHDCAAQARANGVRVLVLTDSADRELAARSDVGLLTPTLAEAPASTLTLFMLEWLAMEALKPAPARSQ
jgi:DNA-binding MurR/RpiR family transcriptional regulator